MTRAMFSANQTDGSGGGVFTHTEGPVTFEDVDVHRELVGRLLGPTSPATAAAGSPSTAAASVNIVRVDVHGQHLSR